MSEPDAVPLPRQGEVFFDVRGESRTMRLSWYADSSVAVFSIWQGNRCTNTFRLPFGDLARMVATLEAGPPSRAPDRVHGTPSHANAGSDPGYGYLEPGGYGDRGTYAGGTGYGSGPQYGTGMDYDTAAAGGRYYGDDQSPVAGRGYRSGEGHVEPDEYYEPRYVPDVAPAVQYQAGYHGPGPAVGPQSPDGPGHERTGGYARQPDYAQPPGYGQPPDYVQPHDSAHGRYQQQQQYVADPDAAYRGATQFLAAPSGQREHEHDPAYEDALSGFAHAAKPGQVTADWDPAAASYRAR